MPGLLEASSGCRNIGMLKSISSLTLESGIVLDDVSVAYETWGRLNEARNNAILVSHGLTGNEDAFDWWKGLFGPGKTFDVNEHFVICTNNLGSCYGTTGPRSNNPSTGERYESDFPRFTIRDEVGVQKALLEQLGIERLESVIGPSMGGMKSLEWCFEDFPVDSAVLIGCGASHSAWAIGLSHTQRQAIYRDPAWNNGKYGDEQPADGLSIARQIAMLAYRSNPSFIERFERSEGRASDDYSVESYLNYQGDKLVDRFDANSYVRLTQMMDSHDVGRGRGGIDAALASLNIPVLVLGISSDVLYPVHEQEELASKIPNASLRVVNASQGHDAFLIELDAINKFVTEWRGEGKSSDFSCQSSGRTG